MTQLDNESWKVVSTAQRFVKSGNSTELGEFELAALKKADYQLGNRDVNAGWRKAIQDFIRSIEDSPEIIEVKPDIFGIALNLNELLKRWLKYFRK